MLWPRLGLLVERAFAPLQRFGPRDKGNGFWSGIVVGGALGFLYAPCAGPILAAVISLSATQGASGELVVVALAYGAGSALVLLLIAFGGRALVERIRRAGHGPAVQRALGVLLLGTAVAMAAELDVRFQTVLANELPTVFSNPTSALERSDAVSDRLADLRGPSRFHEAAAGAALPVLGRAPDFTGNDSWLNTRGDRPLSLRELRGRVVLVDFWTYTCINCLRTFPALRAWQERYARDGLVIVGVHTPEFTFERQRDNVERAVEDNDLRYPIAQDNEYATWNAWGNQYWPAKYLVDARGRVRYAHFGEGAYGETEGAIRTLLEEAGERRLPAASEVRPATAARGVHTPETYLGTLRAQGFAGQGAGERHAPLPGAQRALREPIRALRHVGRGRGERDGGGRRRDPRSPGRARGLPRDVLAWRRAAAGARAGRRQAGPAASRRAGRQCGCGHGRPPAPVPARVPARARRAPARAAPADRRERLRVHVRLIPQKRRANRRGGWLLRMRGILGEAMPQKNGETLKHEPKAHGRSQSGVATSDDAVEIVRKAWEAWDRGDMQAVFDFYDPAVEWDMSESEIPDMGVFRGHEGVRTFFREWTAPFHDYYAHAEDFTLGSEGVVVRLRQGGRGKESGADVEMPPLWQLYRLRAGRAVRVEIYRDEQRAREAAGVRE